MKIVTSNAFPRAMGMDFSGTVMAVGPGVTRFAPGDAVFAMARLKQSGAFGEAVITKESFLVHKPEAVSFEDAACLATPGVMAWMGLVQKARLQAGQQVFVNGCAGAVGEATVQVARMLGATVSGSAGAAVRCPARSSPARPVSLRTVRRDIATLQIMGARIEGEAGMGYILRPGSVRSERALPWQSSPAGQGMEGPVLPQPAREWRR